MSFCKWIIRKWIILHQWEAIMSPVFLDVGVIIKILWHVVMVTVAQRILLETLIGWLIIISVIWITSEAIIIHILESVIGIRFLKCFDEINSNWDQVP